MVEDGQVPQRARDDVRQSRRLVEGQRRNDLRHVRRTSKQRLQTVRREEHRLRQDVDVDHRRSPRRRIGAGDSRTSAAIESPVRRHRVRRVLHGRRRALDAAEERDSGCAGARHADSGPRQRPRRWNARSRHLHPRRPHATRAPRESEGGAGGVPLSDSRRAVVPAEFESRVGNGLARFHRTES